MFLFVFAPKLEFMLKINKNLAQYLTVAGLCGSVGIQSPYSMLSFRTAAYQKDNVILFEYILHFQSFVYMTYGAQIVYKPE